MFPDGLVNGQDMQDTYYSDDYMREPWSVGGGGWRSNYRSFAFSRVVHRTKKAVLLESPKGKFWVPIALCGSVADSCARIAKCFSPKYLEEE